MKLSETSIFEEHAKNVASNLVLLVLTGLKVSNIEPTGVNSGLISLHTMGDTFSQFLITRFCFL